MAAPITDGPRAGHRTLLSGCGLLDRSERGKLALTGPDAAEFLGGQVTNELADLSAGEGRYAAFLTHKGKMLGDLRILAIDGGAGELELLLDTERSTLQALFDMIRRFKVGYRTELHKRTLERGLLSLIGPQAAEVLGAEPGPAEHSNRPVMLDGLQALAVRTDIGLDLICPAEQTDAIALVLRERGASAIEQSAAECLRVESGRPLYGVDLDDTVIPQEAGLNERAVSFTKGCYVGQETVARLHYKGRPNRHLRGLLLSGPAERGDPLAHDGRSVGALGSVAESPRLGSIALALVRREVEPGATVAVGEDGLSGRVVELPFQSPS